jgi:hypothetical protein
MTAIFAVMMRTQRKAMKAVAFFRHLGAGATAGDGMGDCLRFVPSLVAAHHHVDL